MGFKLSKVVPWGRRFSEYREMFMLTYEDLRGKIADFGGGPSSFNAEASELGFSVTSFDPVYDFSREELESRIYEVRDVVMEQMKENAENYIWDRIKNLKELEALRMGAMKLFTEDFDKGKAEGRYIAHTLPESLPFSENTFDIGLSSHFLMMYDSLGYDFHIKSIDEIMRVCGQLRIFPTADLDGKNTELGERVISYLNKRYKVFIVKSPYRFQKGENKLLIIKK